MRWFGGRRATWILALAFLAGGAAGAPAAGPVPPAKIAFADGKVMVKPRAASAPVPAEPGMALNFGDQVKTLKGRCQINLTATGPMRLAPNTTVLFPEEENRGDKVGVVRMLEGRTWYQIKQLAKDEVFEVRTPALVAAVMGTTFTVDYLPGSKTATLVVLEGKVKGILTAAGREVERLVTTGKRLTTGVDAATDGTVAEADVAEAKAAFADDLFTAGAAPPK